MTTQSWKQKNRQKFGYLMEERVSEYYEENQCEVLGFSNYGSAISAKFKKELAKYAKQLPDVFYNHLGLPNSLTLNENNVRSLVMSNLIELIRFNGKKVIISEIKSKFQEEDYRFELSESQFVRFRELTKKNLPCSFIYCIAVPKPRLIEIPAEVIIPLAEISRKKKGSKIRVRIPMEYRNITSYHQLSTIDMSSENDVLGNLLKS
jgi:hypothetical protein